MGSVPGFGPFWTYFESSRAGFGPFSACLGDNGTGFWPFVRFRAWIWTNFGLFFVSGLGLDSFWPISGVLGMESSHLVLTWGILGLDF